MKSHYNWSVGGEEQMTYDDDITVIKGIGDKTASLLKKLDIETIGDLLELYPREYDVFEKKVNIADVKEGKKVCVEGFVANVPKIVKKGKYNVISLVLRDETGSINVAWFNMSFLQNRLKIGANLILRGKVTVKNGIRRLDQPEILSKEQYYKSVGSMTPIYPLTKGLSNKTVVKSVEQALNQIDHGKDYLDSKIRKKYDLIEQNKALKQIHLPEDRDMMLKARKRIVFDEFFIFTMALKGLKEDVVVKPSPYDMDIYSKCEDMINRLPYSLTNAQLRTWNEIKQDMMSKKVMNRLVQGDVGSGKTVVAQLALMMAVENGYQGAMMAPTEVLAKQHYEAFSKIFIEYGYKVTYLSGSMTAKEKRLAKEDIKNNQTDIVVGTHAVIEDDVEFANLALVITDEQHRFGVRQRQCLSQKGYEPHMIVMSATPIPRTMAIIMYGDLDISVIDEMPKERKNIKNCVVNADYRPAAYDFMLKQIREGRQCYVICPMACANEEIDAENVIDYCDKLKDIFPNDINITYLHGKMKGKDKNNIMESFAAGDIDILVSTTVIEVGVNVPNATVMLIENAARFGLAQLHQIRGRVGRGEHQSYCVMIDTSDGDKQNERLEILNKSNDGFYIASQDLKLRGPGDLFGTLQSGELVFKLADVFNDSSVLKLASEACKKLDFDDFRKIAETDTRIGRNIKRFTGNTTL